MVDIADALLVVWDGSSTGTEYTIKYAKRVKKPVTLVNLSETVTDEKYKGAL